MEDSTQIVLLLSLIIGCKSGREPIFHLFEYARCCPDADELAYLKSKNFQTTTKGDTLFVKGASSSVDLTFIFYKDRIIVKLASITMAKFDTLLATELIERRFGIKKSTSWNKYPSTE
jgi:hypothetical protein